MSEVPTYEGLYILTYGVPTHINSYFYNLSKLYYFLNMHKDGSWDPEAAAKYEEFKHLHMSQVKKEGVDNLSLKEAYLLVMIEKLGYHRGLGPRPKPPRKGRAESQEIRVELSAEIQQLQQKEAALKGQVGELQSANSELKSEIEQMKAEAIDGRRS